MGLILKKDESEHEVIEGIEVIERSDVPDDLPQNTVQLVPGASAEDIAAGEKGDDADGGDEATMTLAPEAVDTTVLDDDADDADGSDGGDGSDDGDDGDGSDGGDDAVDDERDDVPGASGGPLAGIPRNVVIGGAAALVIVAVVAAVVGYFVGSGSFGGAGTGSAVIEEGQLDTVVASYTYDGASHDITARDAIESQYSLDTAKNEDGTYSVPSAETIIAYVRNLILVDEATARGIEVSDDEMASFAESMLGTSDYATLAEQYGVSEDQAQKIVQENATINKLYNQVVPEASDLSAPTDPTAPEDGDTSASSAEYAEYIIGLAGDEWDADAGTWASKDGSYYEALGDDFTGDTATYEQAVTAYYVAYQQYSEKASQYYDTWMTFVNGLYAKANIKLYGLYV